MTQESDFEWPWLVDDTGMLILHMFYMLSLNNFANMRNPVRLLTGPAFQSYVKTGEVDPNHTSLWESAYRWYKLSCKKNGITPLKLTKKLVPDEDDD